MKKILRSKVLGFSLIEALIAALVVAVAMLGMAKLQGITLLNSADSRMKTHALNLAQDKIEQLRTFANQGTYNDYSCLGNNTDTTTGANSTFTRTWWFEGCVNSVDFKQANVDVAWTDPKGAAQIVRLTSYIAKTDPVKSGVILLAGTSTSSTSSSTSSTSSSTGSSSTGSTSSSTGSSSTGSTSSSTGSSSTSSTGSSSTGSSTGSTSTSSSSGGSWTCTWTGGTVADGASVTAYLSATVPYGDTCTNQSRICTNGTLSGSYNYLSCTIQAGATCTINGSTVASGESVTAYQSATPAGACVSESRLCTNGSASGSYTYSSCIAGCTLGSTSVASGGSITAYQNASVTAPATCVNQSRICSNGVLAGSYTNLSCSVTSVPVSCNRTGGSSNYQSTPSGFNSCCAVGGCSGNNCTYTKSCSSP